MSGHAEQAHLRTLDETRDGRADLEDTRTLARLDGCLWFHTMRHHRTHPATVEGCHLCDLLLELSVLLQAGGRP